MRRRWKLLAPALLGLALLAGCNNSSTSNTAPGGGAVSDASTVKAIQDKIAADKSLAGCKITVKAQGGTIDLEGTVKKPEQKDTAEGIVTAIQTEKHQQTGVTDNLLVQEGK